MRAFLSLALLALLARIGAAETLFKVDEPATVSQQRGRSLLQTVPLYGCPLATFPAERTVQVYVTIVGRVAKPAYWGQGQKALFDAIKGVYTKFGRDTIAQSQITGPLGQGRSTKNKTFLYTFSLPLGVCGKDKKLLDVNLRKAIATLKTPVVRGAKLALWK